LAPSISTLHPPPAPSLFPYTTLFRSVLIRQRHAAFGVVEQAAVPVSPWPADRADIHRSGRLINRDPDGGPMQRSVRPIPRLDLEDRKSTRLNSSHVSISYAVFCLKKK